MIAVLHASGALTWIDVAFAGVFMGFLAYIIWVISR